MTGRERTKFYDAADGVRIHYREFLSTDNPAETIMFIHGLGANSEQFVDDAIHFSKMGYRCLAVDLRGHGQSTAPHPISRQTLSVMKMAHDLEPLIDKPPTGPSHIVGNSLGGLVALHLANRCVTRTASLTCFGTTYQLGFPPGVAGLQYFIGRIMGAKRLSRTISKTATQHEHARDILRQMYADIDFKLTYQIQKNIRKYDYRDILDGLSVPVMIIQAENDTDINRNLNSTLDVLDDKPAGTLVQLPDAGHFANLDQPGAFRKHLSDFISTHGVMGK